LCLRQCSEAHQLVGQVAQAGAPLTTVQYWLEAQLVPQLGCVQVVPFQPGRQAVQEVPLVQDAQLVGQLVQVAVVLVVTQYWLVAQVGQEGVEQLGGLVQPAAQVRQVLASEQVAHLELHAVQPGAPLTTVQNWLEAQLLPQSGCEQVAPFQPGRQAVQVVAPLQDAQLVGQAVHTPDAQYWLAAQLVQGWGAAFEVV